MKILKSLSRDPERNLALEQHLLMERTEDFLLFYINSPAVVIGRNQSPEAEADLEWCRERGIPMLRRISGGGAVYHDGGNVNFSFITARDETSLPDAKPLEPVIAALASMGVAAMAGSRGELRTEDGRKISGTASCVRSLRQMFHGTLLFDADLGAMAKALAGNPLRRGKKVASVPSETCNLKPMIRRTATTEEFMDALASFLAGYFDADGPEPVIF